MLALSSRPRAHLERQTAGLAGHLFFFLPQRAFCGTEAYFCVQLSQFLLLMAAPPSPPPFPPSSLCLPRFLFFRATRVMASFGTIMGTIPLTDCITHHQPGIGVFFVFFVVWVGNKGQILSRLSFNGHWRDQKRCSEWLIKDTTGICDFHGHMKRPSSTDLRPRRNFRA